MNSSKKIVSQQKKEAADGQKKKEIAAKVVKAPHGGRKLSSYGDGPSTKSVVLGIICVLTILVLCIGVCVQQLKPDVYLKVNNTKITKSDMMYPIYECESTYEAMDSMYKAYTGTGVWDSPYQGASSTGTSSSSSTETNREGLKSLTMSQEIQYEVLYQEAQKKKYSLTEKEVSAADKKADEAVKGLSWSQKFQLGFTKRGLHKLFEKRALADKYKEAKQKELNKTVNEKDAIKDISKKDYREYDVEYYSAALSTTDSTTNKTTKLTDAEKKEVGKKLEELQKKAATASDFTKLLGSDEKQITYNTGNFTEKDGWNMLSDANLKIVKKMKNGDISQVFYDDKSGYYLFLRMKDNNSSASYDTACKNAITQAQQTAFNNWYQKLVASKAYNVKTYSAWNNVEFGTVTTSIVTASDLAKMQEKASKSSKKSSSKKSSSKSSK